ISRVISGEECPSSACTVPRGVPTESSSVAFEWRRECQLILGRPRALQIGASCRFDTLRRQSGVPFFVQNTSASTSATLGRLLDRISTAFALNGTVRLLERVLGSSKCPS